MKIPYFKQETIWTCGPAVVRSALAYFGIKKSERQLVKELNTNKIIGTRNKAITSLIEKYKLNYIVERNKFNPSKLKKLYEEGHVILIDYHHVADDKGHFAIIEKIDDKRIALMDPWEGPGQVHSINKFKKIWYDDEGNRFWYIAISRPPKSQR
ncbi:MAG: cysteine peptidase family C39 domain-containing protein [Nanoarchaeota archaeon]